MRKGSWGSLSSVPEGCEAYCSRLGEKEKVSDWSTCVFALPYFFCLSLILNFVVLLHLIISSLDSTDTCKTHTQSKTSAVVIEACIVAVSLPVCICLRLMLISALGVLMSARIQKIYLQLSWKYASNTPEVMQDISIYRHAQLCMHKHKNLYNPHTVSQDN